MQAPTNPFKGIDTEDLAAESIPVVLALVLAIIRLAKAKEDPQKQLDALMDAAEAVKERMDEVKFPNEVNRG